MKNRIQKIVLMVVFLLTLTPLPLSAQATISEEPDFPEIKSDYVYMVDLDNNQIMLDELIQERKSINPDGECENPKCSQ